MRKRICILGFMALSFVCGSTAAVTAADQPASAASIDELLQVTQAHKLVDSMVARVDSMMRQSIAQAVPGKPIDTGEQKIIDAQIDKWNNLMKLELSWDSVRPMYVDVYSKTFSQKEIDAILTFYRSPAGQSMIAKMPTLTAQLMQAVQAKMAVLRPQLQQISQDAVNQLKAYEANKQSAAAPATKAK